MVSSFLYGVQIGRWGGIGLGRREEDLSCELSQFGGCPACLYEATEGFTLLVGADVGANFLEVGNL
jgi:hypothetical protein